MHQGNKLHREHRYKAFDREAKRFVKHSDIMNDKVPTQNTRTGFRLHSKFILVPSTGLYSMASPGIPKKEAFEGDVIRFVNTDGQEFIKLLWFNTGSQCLMVGNLPYYELQKSPYIQPSILEFEIIGSVYTHPEFKKYLDQVIITKL